MSLLDGFELYTIKKEIYLSVFKGGISLGGDSWNKLGKAPYVDILSDPGQKKLAVRKGSRYKVEAREKKVRGTHIRKACEEMMGMEVGRLTYRVGGEWLEEEKALIYDMREWGR